MCGGLVNEWGIKVVLDLAQVSELSQERYRLAAELEALQGVEPPPPRFPVKGFPWPPNSMVVSSQLVSAPSWASSWEHAW